jgi:hypothetical protein
MGDNGDVVQAERTPDRAHETFALERFGWEAPDRLELCGTFAQLRDVPLETPVLVVRGAERAHRLPAVSDGAAAPPEQGRPWRAEFAWQEAPEAFDGAQLELGPDLLIELPAPGASSEPRILDVRRTSPVAEPAPEPASGANRLRSALAAIGEALDAEQQEADQLRAELRDARAELDDARAELEQFRAQRDAAAAAEAEAQRLRGDYERARQQSADAVDALTSTRSALDEARGELDRALARLNTADDGLGGEA